jgi:hypothetical protein
MIVFDLICQPNGHIFEAWFGSSDSFQRQKNDRLLQCPICASANVDKAVMAPHVGAKSNQRSGVMAVRESEQSEQNHTASQASDGLAHDMVAVAAAKSKLAALAQVQSAIIAQSDWVGRDFARQARAMDAGELTRASIYGEASLGEVKSLIDDGVEVMPLPLPVVPPNQSN